MKSARETATEEQVRDILQRHFRKVSRALLSKKCRMTLDREICARIDFLEALEAESRRKTRSKAYLQLCQSWITAAATDELGPLERLSLTQLSTLDKLLNSVVASFTDRPPCQIPPTELITLQKKLLYPAKKAGRKPLSNLDLAFVRRMNGEKLTAIVKDLEPQNFQAEPEKVLQRYSKAIQRRKRMANRV